MSKTRVFIYGSCVSRDTFEHLDPEQFELVEYVARQSALSATTRPVEMLAPPTLESRFQQRMVTGDFQSSLRPLLAQHANEIDVLLLDLTDERLGVYLLPDGTVVTRSVELIESGAEQSLPQGAHHVAFGTQQHFEYWSGAIRALGESIRQTAPRAAIALLDIPWAEWSESGQQTPDSFGIGATQANPVFRSYVDVAVQALGAHVVALDPSEVMSGPHHPWGEAPFHYAENVYLEAVRRLTGAEGRVVWGPGAAISGAQASVRSAPTRAVVSEQRPPSGSDPQTPAAPLQVLENGPNFIIAGTHRGGTTWLQKQLSHHPDIFIAPSKASNFFNSKKKYTKQSEVDKYLREFKKGERSRMRGERSIFYFWNAIANHHSPQREDAAAVISQMLPPDTKILVSLRDPVSRAVSAYWHNMANGNLTLGAGLFRSPASAGVIDLGFYRRHYEHWVKMVGPDRIQILLYDDIVADPTAYVRQALKSLDLYESPDFWQKAALGQRVNANTAMTPIRKANQVTAQELSLLVELYRDDIAFIEHITHRQLDDWRDVKKIAAQNAPK